MLLPGSEAHSHVRVHVKGVDSDPSGAYPGAVVSASVYRGAIATSVSITVTSPVAGQYVAAFTLPVNWVTGDLVFVEWTIAFNKSTRTSCMKPVGIVGTEGFDAIAEGIQDRILDLLEADQAIENGFLVFYEKGTRNALMRKAINGSTCAKDVSLVEPVSVP